MEPRNMSALSESVLVETTKYLGPASRQFLERQTKGHLDGLLFDNLEKKHIPLLAHWIIVSAGLIIDKKKAEELGNKILSMG